MIQINSKRFHSQFGYSLLEVMVAVVVLSIGLAALGLLQIGNVQNSYNANNRSMAATAAQDMAERMRANLAAYENGTFVALTAADRGCDSDDTSTDCTTLQLAENDLQDWQDQLENLLPAGAGIICIDDGVINDGNPDAPSCSGNGNTVIKVFWRESAGFSSEITTDDINNAWQAYGLPVYP